MSHNATDQESGAHDAEWGAGMSDEEVKSLWRDVTEIKASLKIMDQNIRESFAKLPCTEMVQRVAKAEQRLDNGSQNTASSRAWVSLIVVCIFTVIGWGVTLFVAFRK